MNVYNSFGIGIKAQNVSQELLTKDEIKLIVKESSDRIPKSHEEMIVNMLDLEKVKIEDAMIPRGELIAVDIESDKDQITQSILKCKHTNHLDIEYSVSFDFYLLIHFHLYL